MEKLSRKQKLKKASTRNPSYLLIVWWEGAVDRLINLGGFRRKPRKPSQRINQ